MSKLESSLLPHVAGYVGGQWVSAASAATFDVHDPANGDWLAAVPSLSLDEVNATIATAQQTFAGPIPSLAQRKQWLTQIATGLRDNAQEIGRILTREHGKPWKESRAEVEYAAGFFAFCAENIDALAPRPVPHTQRGGRWIVHQRPAGVVGLITPWNFPIAMIAKKLSAAIAAGCPSVIKPASKTPLTMIALFTLLDRELQLPPGFVNLVMGSASMIGRALCEHPDVAVISFTGSTAVGQQLIAMSAPRVKRLSLELGGNAPFVVFADADLDAAATHLIANKFRAGGQTCVCTNRVLVQRTVMHDFAQRVAGKARTLTLGHGLSPETDLGPLIDGAAWHKVNAHVTDAIDRGATRLLGDAPTPPQGDIAAFYPPTVLHGVTPQMLCFREETFGPLVPIAAFDTEHEAITLANDTEYGLASYVFTNDEARAQRVIERLQFGHVGLNTGVGPTPEAPFGGFKASGYGREGGLEGLHEFVQAQTVAQP